MLEAKVFPKLIAGRSTQRYIANATAIATVKQLATITSPPMSGGRTDAIPVWPKAKAIG